MGRNDLVNDLLKDFLPPDTNTSRRQAQTEMVRLQLRHPKTNTITNTITKFKYLQPLLGFKMVRLQLRHPKTNTITITKFKYLQPLLGFKFRFLTDTAMKLMEK